MGGRIPRRVGVPSGLGGWSYDRAKGGAISAMQQSAQYLCLFSPTR